MGTTTTINRMASGTSTMRARAYSAPDGVWSRSTCMPSVLVTKGHIHIFDGRRLEELSP